MFVANWRKASHMLVSIGFMTLVVGLLVAALCHEVGCHCLVRESTAGLVGGCLLGTTRLLGRLALTVPLTFWGAARVLARDMKLGLVAGFLVAILLATLLLAIHF